MEIRLKDIQLDCDKESRKIGGYINVTERQSETLYSHQRKKWFKETMQKGVFKRSLERNNSIPLLLEHNWDSVLAHTDDGSFELREDNIGLRFDATIADEETYNKIVNRQINSCSFGFRVKDQRFEDVNSRLENRYVTEIELLECSLVANPAYVGSLVEQRNLETALEEVEEITEEIETVEESVVEDTVEEVKETEVKEEVADEVVEDATEEVEETADEVVEVVEETTNEVVEEVKEQEDRSVEEIGQESNVVEDAKEIIQEVIDQKQDELEFVESVEKNLDEYKEEVKECAKQQIEDLENESYNLATQALRLKFEILKLKETQMKL